MISNIMLGPISIPDKKFKCNFWGKLFANIARNILSNLVSDLDQYWQTKQNIAFDPEKKADHWK